MATQEDAMTNTPPDWLPALGSTVHLRLIGSRKKPVAYTIYEYKEFEPGGWVFKANGPRGTSITDGIETLR